ncbi:hypothetical protein QJS10_CPA05g01718 [Acorus calamus]|uniref:Uncharacterized protein n=1 Tax=Acorus calamus TaxID=4465 RepID=A0AAV9ETD2_ACOCL|nr:hypothetical protein QJS10_CPA05g01718 [Acorus calamus]
MRGNHQFDGDVGVGGHGAGLLSDDDFEAWITTLLEEDFDMTPIDFDMDGSNILENQNIKKKSRHTKEHIQALNSRTLRETQHEKVSNQNMVPKSPKPLEGIGTSDQSMLSAVNGPSSLFNVLESGLSLYSTMIPIIPQGNAPQLDIIFESSSLAFHQGF